MAEKTKLARATSKSGSLRTTVPKSIAIFLRLRVGETLIWEMEIIDNERVAVVKTAQKRADLYLEPP